MNTNNYDSEATQFEDNASSQTRVNNETAYGTNKVEAKKPAKGGSLKRAVAGAGAGIVVGGAAAMLMGMKLPDNNILNGDEDNSKPEHPEWVDDQVPVANSVSDDMSFVDAFNAARAEVGPGGVFEWHGQIYSTYTSDEWNNMTAEERAEYGEHFSWNDIDSSNSDVAQNTTSASHTSSTAEHTATHQDSDDDDIEVVSVTQGQTNTGGGSDTPIHTGEDIAGTTQESEIEVLGVVHDGDTGANIGGLMVDGQEVIVVDVDGDMNFDYIAIDANGNGEIDQNEIADIHDQNLTVNDLGGFSGADGSLDSNIEPDYSDGVYGG